MGGGGKGGKDTLVGENVTGVGKIKGSLHVRIRFIPFSSASDYNFWS